MKRVIVGITGTHGAGKGTAVEEVVKRGFAHFSVREFLLAELARRNSGTGRPEMHALANELRSKYGSAHIISTLYRKAICSPQNVVIESIYTVGEIDEVRADAVELGESFVLLAVDADQKIRYERIKARQSETDKVSFEQFAEQEQCELVSADPARHNLLACRDRADKVITNNGTKDEYQAQVMSWLSTLVG
ncbi:MAG: AAA family ATPase [Patescibacteria group bacterium]